MRSSPSLFKERGLLQGYQRESVDGEKAEPRGLRPSLGGLWLSCEARRQAGVRARSPGRLKSGRPLAAR